MPKTSPYLLALILLACSKPAAEAAAPTPLAAAPSGPHRVVVFATASLREPFTAMARRYEADHPGAVVELRCEGGAQLLAAMNGGAKADVLAVADSSLMSRFAASAFLAPGSPTELARNRIAIAVCSGNPLQVRSLADLARPAIRVALGTRSSSIGRHSRWVLSRPQLVVEPRVEAATADAVLSKLAAGEADAAIVYVTTLRGAKDVESVAVPEADNTPVLYSISVVSNAAEPAAAAAFRALALGPEGQAILRDAGFLPIGAK